MERFSLKGRNYRIPRIIFMKRNIYFHEEKYLLS